MNDAFYRNIRGFNQFTELTNRAHFTLAPADWHVVMCDVKNSTQAIQKGRYKEVNMVGAAAIKAILNVSDGVDVPYAFGGDGASLLVPSRLVGRVKDTLEAVQGKVMDMMGMELCAACIPLAALYRHGTELRVGRFYLSADMSQAVFHGTALALAESWLKQGHAEAVMCVASEAGDPNLAGLECRWQPIPNRNGMILSMMAKVLPGHLEDALSIHAQILREIGNIYPEDDSKAVTQEGMKISFSPKILRAEVVLRGGSTWFSRFLYLLRILALNSIGQYSFSTGKTALGFDGHKYLSEMAKNSDSRKFDECLRMVLDSNTGQRDRLVAVLEQHHQAGEIVYGMHSSAEALMTCLVFSLAGNHVHFVDGGDGGYALAALQMKQQLKMLQPETGNAG